MNGERVGFSHATIAGTESGFRITAEGSVKLLVLGFSREATARETYEINRDLTLRAFHVEQTIDKSPLTLSGTVSVGNVHVTQTTKGGASKRTIKLKGSIYPPPVINLLPLIKGWSPGRRYTVRMLDVEEVRVKEITIEAVGTDVRNDRELLHLRNNLYPVVDNDIWLDFSGNTIEESVSDGLIVTRAESAENASRWLLEDAVAKKDLVFDFSLVTVDRELPDPASLKRLVLDLAGYPETYPLPEGPGQNASRMSGTLLRLTMTAPLRQISSTPLDETERTRYLAATARINADHPELLSVLRSIVPAGTSGNEATGLLVPWVARYLDDTVTDSHSAYEALQLRKGNCQSHARLYTALARGVGIPTRMVSGLVYVKGKGFLYHTWSESWLGGWVAVDPAFGQVPADVTHIRLVAGDEPEEIAPLAGIIGKIKASIIEAAQ